MEIKPKTYFDTPERSDNDDLKRQMELLESEKFYLKVFDNIPLSTIIINENRQIIFANKFFQEMLESIGSKFTIGLRTGEALLCVHSDKMEGGCGTFENCAVCGAANAIFSTKNLEKRSIEECRITLKNGDCLDLLMWSTPITAQNERFIFCSLTNIADEKRRRVLERIFFHDILNTAGGLKGFVSILELVEKNELNKYLKITSEITDQLIDEIQGQRSLTAAENKSLEVNPRPFSSFEMLREIKLLYEKIESAEARKIDVDPNSFDKIIVNDRSLVRRVLGNLTRNALESIQEGEHILISCEERNKGVEFLIKNDKHIPKELQMQMFQRSFTTKGIGRGLGTYGAKIITENYLSGKISFTSDKKNGTIFKVLIPNI